MLWDIVALPIDAHRFRTWLVGLHLPPSTYTKIIPCEGELFDRTGGLEPTERYIHATRGRQMSLRVPGNFLESLFVRSAQASL